MQENNESYKFVLVDYSIKDNSIEELKKICSDTSVLYTGIEFFNKYKYTIAPHLENYFNTIYKYHDTMCQKEGCIVTQEECNNIIATDNIETYKKFCDFVDENKDVTFTRENPGPLFEDYCDTTFTKFIKEHNIHPLMKVRFDDKYTFYSFNIRLTHNETKEEFFYYFRF